MNQKSTLRTTRQWVFASILLGLVVLGSLPTAAGQTSGTVVYTFGSRLSDNQSNYTLYYSLPPAIQVGAKTNMTFYVYLTELSGWKIQSQKQILQIIINTPTKSVTKQEVQNNVTLYQGGRWGPFNMTIDLNDSQAGLSPGQVTNATVFANLVAYEAYDNPAYPFVQDAGETLKLADLQIVASPASQFLFVNRLFVSLAVGATVAVATFVVVTAVTRRDKSGSSSHALVS